MLSPCFRASAEHPLGDDDFSLHVYVPSLRRTSGDSPAATAVLDTSRRGDCSIASTFGIRLGEDCSHLES